MAKKKKGKGAGFDSGNPMLDALTEMLSGLSPEQQMQFMDNLDTYMRSGKSLQDMQDDMYTYQQPDYTKEAKPLAQYLEPLQDAAKPSEVMAAYAVAYEAMSKLSEQEREADLRNFFMNLLADGLTHDFDNELNATCLPMIAAFMLTDDFKLTGLFDVILETMKQAPSFYQFYFGGFGDAATLILAHVGVGHLEELKTMMKTDGFVSEVYPVVLNAVVQMAVENPFCRLQVLAWVSDVLKSCIDTTVPSMAMDWIVKSLAQIKAVDLLPLIKEIYKKYNVPPVEIKGGIKAVTKLLSEGTDDRIVEFLDFKELMEVLMEGEADDFEFNDDDEELGDELADEFDDDDDEEYPGCFWLDDDDERDADALFFKECGINPNASKSKAAKGAKAKSAPKGKKKYALTIDVALKGSPRKVYRQLVVPSDLTLDSLGVILMLAVGWDGYHLNQFIDGKTYYTEPSDDCWGVDGDRDASKYTIGSLLRRVKSKVKWEYDFGDSWIHEITLVEKQAVDADEIVKIELIKGTGACPPEDCGGVGGYRHLLNVIKDPDNEEYEEMIGWLGGNFDPKSFSIAAARKRVDGYAKRMK